MDNAVPPLLSLSLLVVEDSEDDYALIQLTLDRQGVCAHTVRVETAEDFLAALHGSAWDAVISDYHLPSFSGDEALRLTREQAPLMPIIIVSGTLGEDAAVASMRDGADDYLIKGRLGRLRVALENAIASAGVRAERQAAQQALAISQAQLQTLSAHLQTAVDEERLSIARELHDEIGSGLAALRFDLNWLSRRPDTATSARADEAQQQLTHLLEACQRIIKQLRPPVLDSGLLPALEWHISQFRRRSGLAVHFDCNRSEVDTDGEISLIAYRTLQEALTNISKHSQATRVRASLIIGDDMLSLEISDDGIGITPQASTKEGSFGLRGLTERARRADGFLETSSGPAGGCSLLLGLPLRLGADA